jgi:hypothetical protein
MKLISHRGNINGENIELENTPDYIDEAISLGYDVEIDIWKDEDGFYLGHDEPIYPIELEWLIERKNNLWIHCKDFNSLTELIKIDTNPMQLKIFYHQEEEYTIISDNHIWAHNIETADNKCIIPLLSRYDIENWIPTNVYGVCSDYIEFLKV